MGRFLIFSLRFYLEIRTSLVISFIKNEKLLACILGCKKSIVVSPKPFLLNFENKHFFGIG